MLYKCLLHILLLLEGLPQTVGCVHSQIGRVQCVDAQMGAAAGVSAFADKGCLFHNYLSFLSVGFSPQGSQNKISRDFKKPSSNLGLSLHSFTRLPRINKILTMQMIKPKIPSGFWNTKISKTKVAKPISSKSP
mgnify:CR=1 FL=1